MYPLSVYKYVLSLRDDISIWKNIDSIANPFGVVPKGGSCAQRGIRLTEWNRTVYFAFVSVRLRGRKIFLFGRSNLRMESFDSGEYAEPPWTARI